MDNPDQNDLEQRLAETAKIQHAHALSSSLAEFDARESEISKQNIKDLQFTIDSAKVEEDVQQFLEDHPAILVQHLGGGHGRWCIPKKRLGSEYVPDFLMAEMSSIGFEWYGVELENPTAQLFNQNGDPSSALTHAIRQITDWRAWLKDNVDYARRLRSDNGLGLIDIDSDLPCYILIGRRKDLNEGTRRRRRQMIQDLDIQIHTYDWLIEAALNGYLRQQRHRKRLTNNSKSES